MFRIESEGKRLGIANDWDLAADKGYLHNGLECAGTDPFMALDLLDPEMRGGDVDMTLKHSIGYSYGQRTGPGGATRG